MAMVVLRLAGVALPIALFIVLLGAARAWIGGDTFVGGVAAPAQALGWAWVAATIALLIVRRFVSAPAEGARRRPIERRLSAYGDRGWWLLLPSVLAGASLVRAGLTGDFGVAAVTAALIPAVLFTLIVIAVLATIDRRRAGQR